MLAALPCFHDCIECETNPQGTQSYVYACCELIGFFVEKDDVYDQHDELIDEYQNAAFRGSEY